jgi:hypothetical protein
MSESVYRESVVCFIDILGFKEHIKRSENDEEHAKRILTALKIAKEIVGVQFKGVDGWNTAAVSDSIIITYATEIKGEEGFTLKGTAFSIILNIIHVMQALTRQGFLFRGAVKTGKMHHNDDAVFGPALTNAYLLEQSAAVYPRVLVSDDVFDFARNHPHNSPDEDLKVITSLVRKDVDGCIYIDFLSQEGEIGEWYPYDAFLKEVRDVIVAGAKQANAYGNIGVRSKYVWLANYFNAVVEEKGLSELLISEDDY